MLPTQHAGAVRADSVDNAVKVALEDLQAEVELEDLQAPEVALAEVVVADQALELFGIETMLENSR